jgi:hypothetical protein
VNDFVSEQTPIDVLQIDESVAQRQAGRLAVLRKERSQQEVDRR